MFAQRGAHIGGPAHLYRGQADGTGAVLTGRTGSAAECLQVYTTAGAGGAGAGGPGGRGVGASTPA